MLQALEAVGAALRRPAVKQRIPMSNLGFALGKVSYLSS